MDKNDSVERYPECEHCELPIKDRGDMVTVTQKDRQVYYHKSTCWQEYCD